MKTIPSTISPTMSSPSTYAKPIPTRLNIN
jgi:hypothetical protein